MGLFDFFKSRKKDQSSHNDDGKQKSSEPLTQKDSETTAHDITKQLWEQFGEATNRKVTFTSHLLLLQQLIDNAFFIYRHSANTDGIPTYMWAENKLFFGDNSKIAYSVPFLAIRTFAKQDISKFDKAMDLINSEFQTADLQDPYEALQSIKGNGFVKYNPDFNITANIKQLNDFHRDSASLLQFINVFGDNVSLLDLLPSSHTKVHIQNASQAIDEFANECIEAFRDGNIVAK